MVFAALPAGAQLGGPYGRHGEPMLNRYEQSRSGGNPDQWGKRLDSDSAKERLEAVEMLGRSADSKTITYLLKAIDDTDPRVQAKAIDYLGSRRATEATPLLVQKLFFAGGHDSLRQRALTALGKIGDPSASRPILDYVGRETNPAVRGTAIFALGELGDATIRDDLNRLAAAETDPRLKRLMQEASMKIVTVRRAKTQDYVQPSSALVPPLRPEP
ncbi:MAG: HEAT repeat domain-containing protein [Candidatus Binatia bacterium]